MRHLEFVFAKYGKVKNQIQIAAINNGPVASPPLAKTARVGHPGFV